MDRLIERFSKLFIARENVVGKTIVPEQEIVEGKKVKGNCTTENRSVTIEDFENHIKGKVGIGLSPLLQNNKVRWASLDIDIYSGLDIVELSKKYNNIPIFFCQSKSHGLHVYLFFKKMFPAKEVRQLLEEISCLLKLPIKEIFPKQENIKPEQQSNWINLCYFSAHNTVRYAIFNGIRLTLEQFVDIVETNLISDFNEDLLKKFTLSGAPPCLLKLFADGVVRGYRDVFLLNLGVFLKQKYKTDWEEKLHKCNQEYLDDPLPDKELDGNIIKQLSKKDVYYQCRSEMAQWCNKKVCGLKKYGLSTKNSPDMIIEELRKIETIPPTWELVIMEKVLKLSTEDLMNINVVRKKCLELLDIIIPQIKQKSWDMILDEKLVDLKRIPAPEDAQADSEFKDLVELFIEYKAKLGKSIEDTTREHIFIKDNVNLFQSKALLNFLRSKKYNIKNKQELWEKVRGLGGKDVRINNFRLWSLPLNEKQKLNNVETRPEINWEETDEEKDF